MATPLQNSFEETEGAGAVGARPEAGAGEGAGLQPCGAVTGADRWGSTKFPGGRAEGTLPVSLHTHCTVGGGQGTEADVLSTGS